MTEYTDLKLIADFALFATIVQTGSYACCADKLGLERTTVYRRISNLEKRLGTQLVEKKGRRIDVTQAGMRCYTQCTRLLRITKLAEAAASDKELDVEPTEICVGAPSALIAASLGRLADTFQLQHGHLTVRWTLVEEWTDDLLSSVDFGFLVGHSGKLFAWTSSLGRASEMLCASSEFLDRSGGIVAPRDLMTRDCIADSVGPGKDAWTLRRLEETMRIPLAAKFQTTNQLEAREATLAGLGVSCLPKFIVEKHIKSGELVQVLPDWRPVGREVSIVQVKNVVSTVGATQLKLHYEDRLRNGSSVLLENQEFHHKGHDTKNASAESVPPHPETLSQGHADQMKIN